MLDVTAFRARFPVVSRHIYFNTAAVGPLSDRAAQAAIQAIEEQADDGSGIFARYEVAVEKTREKVARLIGAEPDEIAFVRNTVEGLSAIASGLRWQTGDNIVMSAQEFSGNVYPWLNTREYGVECRFVPAIGGAVDVSALLGAVDARTRVITVSLVQFSNGYRVDVGTLATRCRERGVRLVVDAIQGVGVVPVDVHDSGVDFLACGAHKWLCAPIGIGFIYVQKDRLPELRLTEVGHGSVVPVPATYTDYRFKLRPDARRFEAGVTSYANVRAFGAALDLLEGVGVAQVRRHVSRLAAHLITSLEAQGYKLRSHQRPDDAAGIVSFTSDRRSSEELRAQLAALGIVVSVRESAIRVSVHAFNTKDEVDTLLAALR